MNPLMQSWRILKGAQNLDVDLHVYTGFAMFSLLLQDSLSQVAGVRQRNNATCKMLLRDSRHTEMGAVNVAQART